MDAIKEATLLVQENAALGEALQAAVDRITALEAENFYLRKRCLTAEVNREKQAIVGGICMEAYMRRYGHA